ncbi:MAG: aldose epimerase family protein [Candidatus Woesearchaeota archaeon]
MAVKPPERLEKENFLKAPLWRLSNDNGLEVILTNFGPSVVSIRMPDKSGKVDDILMGYDSLERYQIDTSSQGRICVGRWANRIANAQYPQPDHTFGALRDGTIAKPGDMVQLQANHSRHILHGGSPNLAQMFWDTGSPYFDERSASVPFYLRSLHLSNGFPGNIALQVIVTLAEDNTLHFQYTAISDRTTPINLTFHGYFNLNGISTGRTVENHLLITPSKQFLEVDAELIPTGRICDSHETIYDFSTPKLLGKDFGGTGYDICLLFPKDLKFASLFSPETGRRVIMTTDQPAFQLYTGFHLPKAGFERFMGVCLEAGKLNDSVNHYLISHSFQYETTETTCGHRVLPCADVFTLPDKPYLHHTCYKFDIFE